MARRSGGVNVVLGADISSFVAGMHSASGSMEAFGKRVKTVGRQVRTVGMTMSKYVSGPIAAAGAAALYSAKQFGQAMSAIQRQTGRSGDEVSRLRSEFREIAKQVPESFRQIADVMSGLEVRMDLTSDQLVEMSTRILDFSRVTNSAIPSVTRSVGILGAAFDMTMDEMTRFLEISMAASHESGIAAADVLDYAIRSATVFKEMGFSLEASIALFAEFEKLGFRQEQILHEVGNAFTRLAREGYSNAEEAFGNLMERIEAAPSLMAATEVAMEAFGMATAGRFANAVRLGIFEVDELLEKLKDSDGVIENMADATNTLADELGILKNQAMAAIAPFGEALVDVFHEFRPLIEDAIAGIDAFAQKFAEWPKETKNTIIGIVAAIALIGPALMVVGTLISMVGFGLMGMKIAFLALGTAAATVAGIIAAVFSPLGAVIVAVVAAVALLANHVVQSVGGWKEFGSTIWETMKSAATWTLGFIWNFQDNMERLTIWMALNWGQIWQNMVEIAGESLGLLRILWDNTVDMMVTRYIEKFKAMWENKWDLITGQTTLSEVMADVDRKMLGKAMGNVLEMIKGLDRIKDLADDIQERLGKLEFNVDLSSFHDAIDDIKAAWEKEADDDGPLGGPGSDPWQHTGQTVGALERGTTAAFEAIHRPDTTNKQIEQNTRRTASSSDRTAEGVENMAVDIEELVNMETVQI